MTGPHRHASHPTIVTWLKRAEDPLRHVVKMINEGQPCLDLATQLHAVERGCRGEVGAVLVSPDLIRAAVLAFPPFVDQVRQMHVLIFALQAASAGFAPAFQAVVPDVLKDEGDCTNALSLLRLAEDMEQGVSPSLAAALLTLVRFPILFAGTLAGFVASALLVQAAQLPGRVAADTRPFWADVTRGIGMRW